MRWRAACRGGDDDRALATLSAMVGAVVLARLCDDPRLADEFLGAARKAAGLPSADPPNN